MMAPLRILSADAPGERRSVLCVGKREPIACFIDRWAPGTPRAYYGAVLDAIVRTPAPDLSGVFVDLEQGEAAFLRMARGDEALHVGQRLRVQVVCEARQSKVARVKAVAPDEEPCSAFEAWRRLYGAEHIEPQPDTAFVEGIFDLVLAPNVALPGGGRINISSTKALVAIDVDRLGREDKGSAGARALAIGAEAVQTAIQQLILRNLGGLCVIDLPGPLNKASGERLQMAALQSFERHTLHQAKVLKPSSLGLMEMSLPWRFRPLHETLAAEG
ncbi:MAG: ribonuclease E/G, partial [Pseudomonadota bacterium]